MKFFRPGEEGGELAEVFLLERLQGVARLFEIGGHFGDGAGRLQRGRQATRNCCRTATFILDPRFHFRNPMRKRLNQGGVLKSAIGFPPGPGPSGAPPPLPVGIVQTGRSNSKEKPAGPGSISAADYHTIVQ